MRIDLDAQITDVGRAGILQRYNEIRDQMDCICRKHQLLVNHVTTESELEGATQPWQLDNIFGMIFPLGSNKLENSTGDSSLSEDLWSLFEMIPQESAAKTWLSLHIGVKPDGEAPRRGGPAPHIP